VSAAGGVVFDRAVGMLAARLPGVPGEVRDEIAATARDAGRRGSRAAEVLSLAGLLVELAARRQTRGRALLLWLQGALAGLGYAALVVALPRTPPLVTALLVVLLPCGALCLARLDPRAAVAVLVFWAWRLALTDVAALLSFDPQLVTRWCAMSAGVLLAWWVTRRSTTTI
jgi:hypothetical protein